MNPSTNHYSRPDPNGPRLHPSSLPGGHRLNERMTGNSYQRIVSELTKRFFLDNGAELCRKCDR